jgi:dolichol-phosphate mannosyltransferase
MLSALLPVLNEEENLLRIKTELIPVLESVGAPWEIVVVNDGSTDSSSKLLKQLEQEFTNVRVLHHPRCLGLGAALRTGFAECRGDRIVTLDSDFTFHPRYIPDLLNTAQHTRAECVAGSPFLPGAQLDAVPAYRSFLTYASNWMYRKIVGVPATSITGIFRLYDSRFLKALRLTSVGFTINAEILAAIIRKGGRVVEVPVPLTGRVHGSSKANIFREACRHLILMTKLVFYKV